MIRADARAIPLRRHGVHAVVTSVPYLAQRRYGPDGGREIGLEDSLKAYVATIADVFDQLRGIPGDPRVPGALRPDGLAWLNIGDKANGSGGAGGDWTPDRKPGTSKGGPGKFFDPAYPKGSHLDVPGAVVAELIARGWRLRLPIVWDKGRQKPEDLRHVRRPRWQHEMIYLLAPTDEPSRFFPRYLEQTGSVWTFPPGGSGPAHLAPFPDELARRCILPSTLPGDTVLDPFAGSGTVERVARQHGRRAVGLDLYAGEVLDA